MRRGASLGSGGRGFLGADGGTKGGNEGASAGAVGGSFCGAWECTGFSGCLGDSGAQTGGCTDGAGTRIGRRLFFGRRLSIENTIKSGRKRKKGATLDVAQKMCYTSSVLFL